jgi:IS30 family transposase
MPNLEAETTVGHLRAILKELPSDLRKSITFDNGSEFALSELIQLETDFPGLKIYYCDPYKSWQKGTVENSHRGFRWHFPKGTDFADVFPEQIRRVEEKLNRRPMKCHGYKTALEQEVLEFALAA